MPPTIGNREWSSVCCHDVMLSSFTRVVGRVSWTTGLASSAPCAAKHFAGAAIAANQPNSSKRECGRLKRDKRRQMGSRLRPRADCSLDRKCSIVPNLICVLPTGDYRLPAYVESLVRSLLVMCCCRYRTRFPSTACWRYAILGCWECRDSTSSPNLFSRICLLLG